MLTGYRHRYYVLIVTTSEISVTDYRESAGGFPLTTDRVAGRGSIRRETGSFRSLNYLQLEKSVGKSFVDGLIEITILLINFSFIIANDFGNVAINFGKEIVAPRTPSKDFHPSIISNGERVAKVFITLCRIQ